MLARTTSKSACFASRRCLYTFIQSQERITVTSFQLPRRIQRVSVQSQQSTFTTRTGGTGSSITNKAVKDNKNVPAPTAAKLQSKKRKKKDSTRVPPRLSTSATALPSTTTTTAIKDYKHSTVDPTQELDQLQNLVQELLSSNSTLDKRQILSQHPDQGPLLAWIYDPLRQFHVRPASVTKYALARAQQRDDEEASGSSSETTKTARGSAIPSNHGYDHLLGLLNALSTRAITGHTALDAILLFMDRFIAPSTITDNKVRISSSHVKQTKELLQHPRTKLFFKILDKNLKTGCNIGMIRNEFPNFLLQTVNVALAHSLDKIENAIPFFEGQPSKTKNSEGTDTTSIIPATSLSQHAVKPWFASRKLDGIRCLVGIDRITGGVEVMSRTGKPLECLGPIQTVFERRGLLLQPRTMTAANPSEGTPVTGKKASSQNRLDRFFSIALGNEEISTDQLPEAIFLDGEICVFTSSVEQKLGLTADGAEFGTENFTKAFQFVRGTILRDGREEEDEKDAGDKDDDNDNDDDIESHSANSMKDRTDKVTGSSDSTNAADDRAMYCVFDCLTEKEFRSRIGTRLFSDRIQGFKNALEKFPIHDSFSSLSSEANNSDFIQVLPQTKIESFNQLETMVGRGIELGWEGVMLRKDVGYEGRRSRNLLKIKQFHDAEYKVEDVTLGRMRLPFEGEYIERDQVLTSVVIRHRGNRVGVGSGFSVEDRIRFGRNPSLILGKTITVQYFEESKTKMATVGSLADNNNNQNRDHKDGGSSPRLENNQKTEVGSDNAAPRSWEEEKIETERNVNNGSGLKDVWSLRFPTVKAIYGSGPRQL